MSGEQYFSAEPSSIDERRTLHVTLRDNDVTVQVSNGVFSASRLDLGTSVLLKHAPELPKSGKFLDIGCGWGPISLAFGLESPEAEVFAIDVNERALELTELNAKNAGLKHIHTSLVDDALKEENNSKENNTLEFNNFDIIWSNPPIRVGKEILHNILLTWIPRLKVGGKAYLVVQKNLGSDSLITWLAENLGESYSVEKYASSKGYRVIEVKRN
ncbi:16S rRNA methyltransferase [Gardnerella vaginalis]|uniref:16S rRNA methyltransferase n=1 Tax=Gardnerella vaginalis TaxID=2702 RepID=A0A3E1IRS0_GARVA|nr:16S rRNA methyltransferase [Gardnerella vaginalis]